MGKDLLFIEKQFGVVAALSGHPFWKDASWILPSHHDFSADIHTALDHTETNAQILSYQSVDLEVDERLKRSLQVFANGFLKQLKGPDEVTLLSCNCVTAAGPVLRDRMFGMLRPYFILAKYIAALRPDRVLLVVRSGPNAACLAAFLKKIGISEIEVMLYHKEKLSPIDGERLIPTPPAVPRRFTPFPTFSSSANTKPGICVITSINDPRTASLILPIVAGLQSNAPTTLFLQNKYNEAQFRTFSRTFGIGDTVSIMGKNIPGEKVDCPGDIFAAMTNALRSVDHVKDNEVDATAAKARDLIKASLTSSAPVITYVRAMERQFQDILSRSSALVVSPAGSLDAALAIETANDIGVPTIEIQRGPVAKETVFSAPRAADLLCIDTRSKQIYTEEYSYPVDRAHVIGSLKLDVDLAPWRQKSQKDARRDIPELLGITDRKVMFLVGQPIDRQVMRQVATIVMAAAAKTNTFVIFKPHHEEDVVGIGIYEEAASAAGLRDFAITKQVSSVQCALASDFVATHYSTVGIEGFALGRKVVAIAPPGSPPPFDLSAIGVANRVESKEQLVDLLTSQSEWNSSPPQETAMLSDGRTKERIVNFILEKAGQPAMKASDGERILVLHELKLRFNAIAAEEGASRALQLLEEANHFSHQERKMLGAYAKLATGDASAGLEGFSYYTLLDKTVPLPAHLEPWLGQVPDGPILIWAQTGIGLGAEVMHLGFLPNLRREWHRLHLVVDDRLVPLVKKAFPGLGVTGRNAFDPSLSKPEEQKFNGIFDRILRRFRRPEADWRDCGHHCSIMSLGRLSDVFTGQTARPDSYMKLDRTRIQRFKSLYGKAGKPLIGLTWKTTNEKQSRRNISNLDALISMISEHDMQFVCLQHGVGPEEAEQLRSRGVIVDDAVNPMTDVEGLFHQVGAMDLVVSIPNSIGHIAGSTGVPTVLLVANGSTPEWQTEKAARFWYRSVDLLAYNPGEFETDVLKQLPLILSRLRMPVAS